MNEDWTKSEVELIVEDYFSMLHYELTNTKYTKTFHRQGILPFLNNRSEGSIEFKHQNISAVLAKLGLPFIKGYKPRYNYQQILETQVSDCIAKNFPTFEKEFEQFASTPILKTQHNINFENFVTTEPEMSKMEDREPTYNPIKINYLEKEQNNRNLGQCGEELVIDYEKYRLIKAGKQSLADRIEWISKEKGDGTGFDILSKNINGTDRYVEVKTTKLTKETPIFLTKTEVSCHS